MASYKDRLRRDVDRWIGQGLVSAEKRDAILDSVPDPRRLDAATALAWVGGALLGVAVIAFVAANWDGIPRIARFSLLLLLFASAAGAGAWAAHKQRPLLCDIALTLAALIFAASIGLTGQIFDIVGSAQSAFYLAGIGGVALALAGRSVGAMIATLAFICLGDFNGDELFSNAGDAIPWLIVFAPIGIALSLRWNSSPLAHIASAGMLVALFWLSARYDPHAVTTLLIAIGCGAAAFLARTYSQREQEHASVFYGWTAAGALLFSAMAGYADAWTGGVNWGLPHRILWLALSGATIALGRFDRHMMVTAAGVISIIIAVMALLSDLGLSLMTAAGVFFLCALAAIVGGLALRKKERAS